MKTIGIYCIRRIQTATCYIGKSIEIENRFKQHKSGHSKCPRLQNAINEHGINAFAFEIVETCPENQLDNREVFWIATLDSYHKGYNETTGAGSGSRLSDETRAKMSHSRLGNRNSVGRTHPPEVREKISKSLKGKMAGEKNGMYGKRLTPEHRQALSKANKGKPKSAKQRQAVAEANRKRKGTKRSAETRAKMSEAHKGIPQSVETRKKRSESIKRWWAKRKVGID